MRKWSLFFLFLLLSSILSGVADSSFMTIANAQASLNPECQLTQSLPADSNQCRIQIGIINSFSNGSGACFAGGIEHKRGYEMALDTIGDIGGCQVELVAVDDQRQVSLAGDAVIELAGTNAPLIIGAYSSGATLEAAREANRLGIPLIVPSASSDLITSMGHEWVFRINATSADYVTEAMALTTTLSETPSIGVVYENTLFGESAAVAVAAQAEELGISVVSFSPFQPGSRALITQSFNTKLSFLSTRLRDANPDVIFLVASGIIDAINLVRISRFENLQPQLFVGVAGAFLSPQFLEMAGEEVENLVATAQWSPDAAAQEMQNDAAAQFVADFQARYSGEMPGMRSVQTYTSLLLAKEAIEQALALDPGCGDGNGFVDRTCVRDALRTTAWENTLFGPVDFDDETGQNPHQVLLVQAVETAEGEFEFVTVFPEAYQTKPITLETAVTGE